MIGLYHRNDGYSDRWILDGIGKRQVKGVQGFEWYPGYKCRGAWVSKSKQAAEHISQVLGIPIEEVSNDQETA
jgi:hypothetical protein